MSNEGLVKVIISRQKYRLPKPAIVSTKTKSVSIYRSDLTVKKHFEYDFCTLSKKTANQNIVLDIQ